MLHFMALRAWLSALLSALGRSIQGGFFSTVSSTNRFSILLSISLLSIACVGPIVTPEPKVQAETTVPIYLVNQGWHTDLVVPQSEIPTGVWPESQDFPEMDYLAIGWGEQDYYPTSDKGVWMTLKAGLFPTGSVLNVVGFTGAITRHYPLGEIIKLQPSRTAFENLCRFIDKSYRRTGSRTPAITTHDYLNSKFYPARGTFHLFRTCNAWTASALRATGYPIGRFSALFSSTLLWQAQRCGVMLH